MHLSRRAVSLLDTLCSFTWAGFLQCRRLDGSLYGCKASMRQQVWRGMVLHPPTGTINMALCMACLTFDVAYFGCYLVNLLGVSPPVYTPPPPPTPLRALCQTLPFSLSSLHGRTHSAQTLQQGCRAISVKQCPLHSCFGASAISASLGEGRACKRQIQYVQTIGF